MGVVQKGGGISAGAEEGTQHFRNVRQARSGHRSTAGLGVKLAVCIAGLGLLLGCAGAGGPVEKWQMTKDQAPQAAQAQPGAMKPVAVVFYREAGGANAKQPVNVYVNGQYQASLVGNTYTEQNLCPGQHTLAAHFNDVAQRYSTKLAGRPAHIDSRPMQYFKVTEGTDGQATLTPVAADQAARLTSLQVRQAHTLARVTRSGCSAS
ncbi:MAG: hypothetical protein WBC18_18895 [Ottowia sp.]|uniref:hypothetical protein n=1 Tax=Ottowia sp. TaxID=1898956 RepID=UPI003C732C36